MQKSLSQRLEDRWIDACAEYGDESWQAKSVKKKLDEELEREEQVLNDMIKTGIIGPSFRRTVGDRVLEDGRVHRLEGDGSLTNLEPKKEKKRASKTRSVPSESEGTEPKEKEEG